jgi:hypothetical protein
LAGSKRKERNYTSGLVRVDNDTTSFESFPFSKVEQSIQFLKLKVMDNVAELEGKGRWMNVTRDAETWGIT